MLQACAIAALSIGLGAAGGPPPAAEGATDAALRLAVMDFVTQGEVPPGTGRALGEEAAAQARQAGARQVRAQADIAARLDEQQRRLLAGCPADDRCIAELADALDADRLLAGSAVAVGRTWMLSVKLLDVRRARTLRRAGATLRDPTPEEVADAARRLAHEALVGRRLDETGVLRVEASEAGAAVELDGVAAGTSPLRGGRRLAGGPHRIVVRKEGFLPWESTVTVAAGADVPVTVTLVPVSAARRPRRMYLDFSIGPVLRPSFPLEQHADCSAGCGGFVLVGRGGYLVRPWLGVEAFLVPNVSFHRATAPAVAVIMGGAAVPADYYQQEVYFGATTGGLSVKLDSGGDWPLVLRGSLGAAHAWTRLWGGGVFSQAPEGFSQSLSRWGDARTFWAPTWGLGVRFGRRISSWFLMDLGVAASAVQVPRMRAVPEPSSTDARVMLPAGLALKGGVAWSYPVDFAVHFDFD